MAPLKHRVTHRVGETPTGYLGRLAAHHRIETNHFVREMGFSWRKASTGDGATLDALAALVGMSAEPLRDAAFRSVDGRWWWGDERIVLTMLRRRDVHVCPRCLLQDVEGRPVPVSVAWQRASWCLTPILTCPDHGIELVEVARAADRTQLHDFAGLVTPALARLQDRADAAPRRRPSGLQDYLLGRKRGRRADPWLDAMPFYAVAELTRLMGRVALWGHDTPSRGIASLGERHAADDAGFIVMSQGERGVIDLLDHGLRTFDRAAARKASYPGVFRSVVRFLEGVANPHDYAAIRNLVGRYVVDRFPLPPGIYLGVPLEHRRLHSLFSAAVEVGVREDYMRDLLSAKGTLGIEDGPGTGAPVVIDGQEHRALLQDFAARLNATRAAERLGLTLRVFQGLVTAGLVEPFVSISNRPARYDLFLPSDLDAFVEGLFGRAIPCDDAPAGHVVLTAATRKVRCRLAAVATAILSGGLPNLRRLRGLEGFPSLMVDPAELRAWIKASAGKGATLQDVCARWRVGRKTACCLRDQGVLVVSGVSSGTDDATTYYDVQALDAFMEAHVSLGRLAREEGRAADDLRSELDGAGVQPLFDPTRHGVAIYSRAKVEAYRGPSAKPKALLGAGAPWTKVDAIMDRPMAPPQKRSRAEHDRGAVDTPGAPSANPPRAPGGTSHPRHPSGPSGRAARNRQDRKDNDAEVSFAGRERPGRTSGCRGADHGHALAHGGAPARRGPARLPG